MWSDGGMPRALVKFFMIALALGAAALVVMGAMKLDGKVDTVQTTIVKATRSLTPVYMEHDGMCFAIFRDKMKNVRGITLALKQACR